jgi:membrane-bound lytic murein transglycosylase D
VSGAPVRAAKAQVIAPAAPSKEPAVISADAKGVRAADAKGVRAADAKGSRTGARRTESAEAADAAVPVLTAATDLPPRTVWDRIRNGYGLAPMENDLVAQWENWYASRPDYVERMIERSSRFLFHVVEEVEKRHMPMEVALLPMIESAYNPTAYSRSHASGIWQFIPATGKTYGLRQNWWYDGRRDIIAATDAALDYLEKLHGMFGDWNLALASYNWGEGAVSRAIEKNRAKGLPTDYESLAMPAETRGYVPKLIAVKNIITNPARFGLTIADVPNEPYFETVMVKQHIDVKMAAKLAEMPLNDFKFLNPGHNKPVIKAGEAERIVLPKNKVLVFLANFDKHDKPLVSWQAVTFRRGDKAEKVAAEHGMTLAELKEVNGLASQRKLVIGQPLLVPVKGGVENPELPDLPVNPVPLQKAFAAVKKNVRGHKPTHQAAHGRASVQKAAQRGAVHKPRKATPARQLRAETGKRVKVVVTTKASAHARKPATKASAKAVKVAIR